MNKDNNFLKKYRNNCKPEKDYNEQKSIQENRQDLDQEQNVNANPFQFNSQNVHVIVDDKKTNYCGRINGISYCKNTNSIIPNVSILLYFGNDTEFPIYKTTSDENGNFVIEDLPPGYYSLKAVLGDKYMYLYRNIKVLPKDDVNHIILLETRSTKEDNNNNNNNNNNRPTPYYYSL